MLVSLDVVVEGIQDRDLNSRVTNIFDNALEHTNLGGCHVDHNGHRAGKIAVGMSLAKLY